jgi:hypothetical protein
LLYHNIIEHCHLSLIFSKKAGTILNNTPFSSELMNRPSKLECSISQLESLTSDKHSDLLGQCLSYEENEVVVNQQPVAYHSRGPYRVPLHIVGQPCPKNIRLGWK